MKLTQPIIQARVPNTLPFDHPPGTPFAVQNAEGEVVGAGVRLTAIGTTEVEQRNVEIQDWLKAVGAHSDQLTSLTNLTASGVDLAALAMPTVQFNPGVRGGLDGLALVSNSASLVNALNSGDSYAATQFTMTAGASAIDLIADSGMFRFSQTLHGVALALKFGKEAYVAYHEFQQVKTKTAT